MKQGDNSCLALQLYSQEDDTFGAGNVAQWVECSRKDAQDYPPLHMNCVCSASSNLTTQKVEAGGLEVHSHPLLHRVYLRIAWALLDLVSKYKEMMLCKCLAQSLTRERYLISGECYSFH